MKKDNLLYEKNSIILFLFSIIGSGLNYLFQIVSGRVFTPAQYGDLNTLFSVFNIATVFGTSLALSIAKITAGQKQNLFKYIKKIAIYTGAISVVLFFALSLCFYKVMTFSASTSIITAFSAILTIFSYIFYGALQGRKSFMSVGVLGFIPPVLKMTVGTGLIFVFSNLIKTKFPVDSVFIALIVSALVSVAYGYKKVKVYEEYAEDCEEDVLVKKTFNFLKFSLVSSVCLVVFNNIDVLIIRHFFNETTVGLYSSALLFGKIILYIPSALVVVMVPTVAENKTDKKVLVKTLMYSIGLASIASLGVLLLKDFIITFLMGDKYSQAAEYILPICLMIIPLVALTVLINYLLASGKEIFVSLCCILAIACIIVLVIVFNSSVKSILYTISLVYLVLFIVLLTKALFKSRKV